MKTATQPTQTHLDFLVQYATIVANVLGEHTRAFFENDVHEFSNPSMAVKRYEDGLTVVYHKGEIVFEGRSAPIRAESIVPLDLNANVSTYVPGKWEKKLLDLYNEARSKQIAEGLQLR